MAEDSAAIPVSYTQEQVQQILNVAIARQTYEGEFSRAQLFEIAEELGISDQCLVAAEKSWRVTQSESLKRTEFDQYRQGQLKRKLERVGFSSGALVIFNALTGFSHLWCIYIIGLLALKIGFDAWKLFHQNPEDYEQAFRKWTRQRHLSQFVNRWWTRILSI
jgi:hypothetical protein